MQSIIHCFYSYQSISLKRNNVPMKNTNTNKKMKTKKIFFRKIIFIFYFFVRSEYYNTNKRCLNSKKIQKDTLVWWPELYDENSIIDWERKNQEIFIIVVAVKEIDSINHKETPSQKHSILKEVLFVVNNDKIRSQNKNKQQHKDSLTESVDMLSSFSDFLFAMIYCWYTFCEKKLIRLNKANRTTFLLTNIAEYSSLEKYFIKWIFYVKLKWTEN